MSRKARLEVIKAVLDEATTGAYDFDSYDDYEDFVQNSGCIFGELEAIDEDGTRYWDYAPCFSAENYAGHALFEYGELTELVTWSADTRVYGLDQTSYEEFVDFYDAEEVRHYSNNGGRLTRIGGERHYFGDVPIIEYPNNKQRRGDFEDVITLVDAYNLAQSLTMDDLADFTDAFLILRGMGGTTPEDVMQLRRMKTLLLDGADAGAEWLIKNLNDAYVENVKTRLQRDIHKFSNIPDMSDDSFAGNTSGVAIKYKLIGLEQIRSRKEREFKRGLQRRIELIANILKLKNRAQIDFRDIDIQFTANIPANVAEQAQIVSQLDGLISRKTLLGLLPFVTDAAAELAELEGDGE